MEIEDSVGTITQIIAFGDAVAYKVRFAFGTIILGEKQIEFAKKNRPMAAEGQRAFIKVSNPRRRVRLNPRTFSQ
jgi:hypothetical protein